MECKRGWFAKFSTTLKAHMFTQSKADYSLFSNQIWSSIIILLVYVDDMLIASNDDVKVAELKCFLNSQFTLKDLGTLSIS